MIKVNDIVWCRGFRVRVVALDAATNTATVQLGAKQSLVNLTDLREV